MSLGQFFSTFAVIKAGKVGSSLANMLMSRDWETATEVDIANLRVNFEKAGIELSHSEAEDERTHAIVRDLEGRLQRALAAADVLAQRIEAAGANTDAAKQLNDSLNTVLDQVKEIAGEEADGSVSGTLFEARQDHATAEQEFHELQQIHTGAAATLTDYEHQRDRAQHDMAAAQRETARAQASQQRAEQIAGLKAGVSGPAVALQAMQAKAAALKQQARAATLNTQALTKITGSAKTADDIVAATLAAPASATPSAMDRLRAMKKIAA